MRAGAILIAAARRSAGSDSFEARKARIGPIARKDFAAALIRPRPRRGERADDIASYQLMAAAQLELELRGSREALQWMLDLRIGKADSEGWLLVARFREVTGDIDGALDAVNLGYGRLAPGQERERCA